MEIMCLECVSAIRDAKFVFSMDFCIENYVLFFVQCLLVAKLEHVKVGPTDFY